MYKPHFEIDLNRSYCGGAYYCKKLSTETSNKQEVIKQ